MDDWDAQKILDLYIHDYLMRKNLHNVADTFAKEAGFTPKNVAISTPDGFLTEWWSIFWDMYTSTIAKNPEQGDMLMAKAKQILGSMGKEFPPNMTMPEINSIMQNANPSPALRIPGLPSMLQPVTAPAVGIPGLPSMLQPVTAPAVGIPGLPSMLQPVTAPAVGIPGFPSMLQSVTAPLMSRPGFGFLNQMPSSSTMPRLGQNPNRMGPASVIDFSSKHGEGVTNYLEAIMREQELHRSQAGEFNFTSQLLNIDRLASMMPSSSNPRHVHNALTINNQPPINRVRVANAGIIGMPAVPMPNETRALQIRRGAADTGVGIEGDQVPADECPSTVISHIQKDSQPELAEKTPEQLVSSSSGSSNKVGNPILVDSGLMEKNTSGNNEYDEAPMVEDVDSFFSKEVPDDLSLSQMNRSACDSIQPQGFKFEEVLCLRPSENKLLCCDFSTTGSFLAAAGHEKKLVYIYSTRNATYQAVQGHEQLITDIRFRPNLDYFATSSFDRTIKIWDAANPRNMNWSLVGHAEHVMSLDFHPKRFGFLCSCDSNGEIRFWDINQAACIHAIKGADRHVRFQPRNANLLAAASGNIINLIDIETGITHCRFEGHTSDVNSICWDVEGKYIVSTSEDSARLWSIESGPKCVNELHSAGNRFASCTFHPVQTHMVVVGSYQAIDIWNPAMGNRTWKFAAHEGIVSALARSSKTNTVASVSHDQCIKLWKCFKGKRR